MPERLPPDQSAILAVDDLSVDALTPQGARRVIDGISFALAPSETLCLAGESGSGKSVTALSIMRLLPRASLRIAGGDIRLEGRSLVRLPERAIHNSASKNSRLLVRGPRLPLVPPGTNPLIRSH